MKNLGKFVKSKPEGVPMVTTSIVIETSQLQFVKALNLNLSQMIREYLSEVIRDAELKSKAK